MCNHSSETWTNWRRLIVANSYRFDGQHILCVSLIVAFILLTLLTYHPGSLKARSNGRNLPSELTLIKYSRDLIVKYGNEIWPGFGDHVSPILLRSKENDYLLNHPEPPAGFKQVKGKPNLQVKEGHLLPQPTATAYPIDGRWSVVIPTKVELIRWVRDEMGNSDFQLSQEDYLQTLIHETFHAYQMRSLGGPDEFPTFGFSIPSRALQKRLSEEAWWEARTGEIGELLAQGLKVEDLSGVRSQVTRMLKVSENGSEKLNPTVLAFEDQTEWIEGTARYAGTRAMMEAYGDNSDLDIGIEIQLPSRVRSNLLNQLTSPLSGPTPVRDRSAAMGAVKAMILDRLYPGWKKGFLSKIRSLDELLEVGSSVPNPLTNFPVTEVTLNGRTLIVALANNPSRQIHGLQHVAEIEPLDGMVFTYPKETRTGFWMKDTKISLQIGFFGSAGKLQESVVLDPCNSARCPSHTPAEPFQYVLELPADSEIQLDNLPIQPVQLVLSIYD